MEEEQFKNKAILIVDDELDLREIISIELEYLGAKVFQAENIGIAQKIIKENHIDLVISDIRMPGGTGIDLLNLIKSKNIISPAVLLITGFADITAEDAYSKGAEALMNKPFKLDDLIDKVLRFISPLQLRWKIPFMGDSVTKMFSRELNFSFNNLSKNDDFSLGRGGAAIISDDSSVRYTAGDLIKFNLKFKDLVLSGTGICRWVKISSEHHKVVLGLEFLTISEDCFDPILDYIQKHPVLSFIPSLA